MTCKNCGAPLGEDAKVCKNCGAFVEDSSGYVLLTSDDRFYDYYSDPEKEKKKHPVRNIIIFLLILGILGGGTYLYFTKLDSMIHKPPKVSFSTGSGYIDGGDEIIYITLDNNNIEYIQGVSLYSYDVSKGKKDKPITSSYEYTKNIDDSFRTILFYADELKLEKDKTYKYYYEIKLSFKDDKRIYTYVEPIEFSGNIKNDVGDIVFDHSMTVR